MLKNKACIVCVRDVCRGFGEHKKGRKKFIYASNNASWTCIYEILIVHDTKSNPNKYACMTSLDW